ncbi:MAG: hypothetical protein ACRD3O_16865, partial [Terriglobia bacterium]
MSAKQGRGTRRSAENPPSGGKIPVRVVVFDYGNVLCLPQQTRDLEPMAKLCGVPLDRFRDSYWRFRRPYDRGELDAVSYWASVTREEKRKLTGGQVGEIVELDAKSWSRPNHEALRWVKQLKG